MFNIEFIKDIEKHESKRRAVYKNAYDYYFSSIDNFYNKCSCICYSEKFPNISSVEEYYNNLENQIKKNMKEYIRLQQLLIDKENLDKNNIRDSNGLLLKLKDECSVQIDTLEPMTEFDCK